MRSSAILALISLSCAVFQLGWTFEPSRKFFSNALHAPCNESRFRRDIGDKLDVFNCCGERDNITAEDIKIYEKCIEKLKGEKTVNISSANYSCFAECYARNKNWTDDNGFIIAERYLASAKQFYKEVELQALVDKYGPDCVKDGNRVGKEKQTSCNPASSIVDSCLFISVDQVSPTYYSLGEIHYLLKFFNLNELNQ
ncbi:hypothetical protein C0J52_20302 [Blattella germanica]|nr:hypothetical protein C0J52_20302 [Blattella germanica]